MNAGTEQSKKSTFRPSVDYSAKSGSGLDVEKIQREFPILRRKVRGQRLSYLDNAATTQKPQSVVESVARYYFRENANIHRGVHELSQVATSHYESVREQVQKFLGAERPEEIIFVRGTTEAINLVSNSYGRGHVKEGDEILITHLEHHSNIVPWQMLCEATGAKLVVVPIDDKGDVQMDDFKKLLSDKTKIAAFSHISNALGTINPVEEMTRLAKAVGAVTLVDGAQAGAHVEIDVQRIGCDFYTLSGHKMYGPTGIGALYGRYDLLDAMPPYQGGGDMILMVSFEKTIYNSLPNKFEAGTPNIAGTIGLGAAIDFIHDVGVTAAAAHEDEILDYAVGLLRQRKGVRFFGEARKRTGIISFVVDGIHPHDLGTVLDQEGVAVRAGHHCAQPVMDRFGIPATVRASFAVYNSKDDVDALVRGIDQALELFGD